MKKIFSLSMMLVAIVGLTSCEKDLDSNPTLITPSSFVLNNSEVGSGVVDLSKSSGLALTWSQPVLTTPNAPVNCTYSFDLSSKNDFSVAYVSEEQTDATYITLDETTTECSTTLDATTIDKALQKLNKYEEGELPSAPLYIRVKASVVDAGKASHASVVSNVITVNVLPYYIELYNADPEIWYLIGGDIADGSWGDDLGVSLIPMQTINGYVYSKKNGTGLITWSGYIAGNGFKIRKGITGDDKWAYQIGQNDSKHFVYNDGGSSDIKIDPGFYTITLDTKGLLDIAEKGECDNCVTITPITPDPASYEVVIAGSWKDDWSEDVALTASSASNNHDWYLERKFDKNTEFKFKVAGSWDTNWGGTAVKLSTGDLYGYGTAGGDNIKVEEAGTYLIIFNDITGYYRLIKK